MNVLGNIQARLCNHFCSGKTISNAYYECAFVALVIQQANLMSRTLLYCHLCPVRHYKIFPHYLKTVTIFRLSTMDPNIRSACPRHPFT